MSINQDRGANGDAERPWPDVGWRDAEDEALLVGARMSLRERLEWNARMIELWARWNPELAQRVLVDRVALRA